MCRIQLRDASSGIEVVSVSRNTPIGFGCNIVVEGERSPLTMHRQVLAGLVHSTADIVFLCESDVLYHPSHFAYDCPPDTFVYNTNVWRVRYPDGLAVWADDLQQVSGMCAGRVTLLEFYKMRVQQLESGAFNRHYEPGVKQSVGSQLVSNRMSAYPNLCIRHDANLTRSKWSPDEFRNPKYAKGWHEAFDVIGWGDTRGLFNVHAGV